MGADGDLPTGWLSCLLQQTFPDTVAFKIEGQQGICIRFNSFFFSVTLLLWFCPTKISVIPGLSEFCLVGSQNEGCVGQ